jgi:hypothetical protein
MDEQAASTLAKRLAAYSATADVTLAAAPSASGQIVYHDIEPDLLFYEWNSTIPLDFYEDGTTDLLLRHYITYVAYFEYIF